MSTAKHHYDQLLGDVFTWSVNAHGDPFARAAAWLSEQGLDDQERYLDLGAGFGMHVVPLLRQGKAVTAVDFSARLLGELRVLASPYEARLGVHEADLIDFVERRPSAADDGRFQVILCLGDTLTHLADRAAVRRLLKGAAAQLTEGGRLVLGYRDASEFHLQGIERFVVVAKDATRIMHCLLEPIDAEHLRVTDWVTEFEPPGPSTRFSDYVKLRLPASLVVSWAEQCGLRLERQGLAGGMTSLVFRAHEAAAAGRGRSA